MNNFELAQEIKNKNLPPLEVELLHPLLDHQYVAASFMYLLKKSMNLDEMGVGKTMSTCGSLKLQSQDHVIKAVIMAPSSVVYQWSSEIEKFLGWKTIIVEGSASHRQAQYEYFNVLEENVILLTNYSRPLHDEKYMRTLEATTLVLDEATAAKNPEAKIFKLLNSIKNNFEYIHLLTGTPVTLTLGDFYWLFTLLGIDNVVGSFEEEVEPYLIKQSSRGGSITKVVGATDFDPLIEKIEPYFIRRTLAEVYGESDDPFAQFVNEKPKLTVQTLNYDKHQSEVFQELKIKANRAAREGNYRALETYQQFLQACSSPKLILDNYPHISPKEKFLLDYLSKTEEKVVVYVRYLEFLECLQTRLNSVKINYNTISGKLSSEEQDYQKNQFLNSDSKVLFITGAGKYGLNLQAATTFIFLDIPYNPADILQMINRVYRYGQVGLVKVLLVFLENTIEEDNFRKLRKRQAVLDKLFDTSTAEIFKREGDFTWGFLEKDYTQVKE